MDRSFLSQPGVIEASRRFVCVRLTTYEDAAEAKFLRSLYTGKSGDVENTTFTILTPDAKETLVRTARSTRRAFRDAQDMAATMRRIASRYPGKPAAGEQAPPLPVTADVRLGINVAASDNQPLVVVLAADDRVRAALEAKVAALGWGADFVGRFVYATAASARECKGIAGVRAEDSVLLVEPDAFGQKGTLVRQLSVSVPPDGIAAGMKELLARHTKTARDPRSHRLQGEKAGVFWEPKLPVTDPQEAAARARTKRAIERRGKD